MPIYEVGRHEVHIQYILVEAESVDEAIEIAEADEDTEYTSMEFSHCLETSRWACEYKEESN